MKTSKKQFKSLANRLLVLMLTNEEQLSAETTALIYKTIARDYYLNFVTADPIWYDIQYTLLKMNLK